MNIDLNIPFRRVIQESYSNYLLTSKLALGAITFRFCPLLLAIFSAVLVVISPPALAALHSVNSADALQNALTISAANGEDDTITISAGSYVISQELTYNAATSEDYSIAIVGAGAEQTIINGSGMISGGKFFKINAGFTGVNANIQIKDLTVERGLDGSYLKTNGNVSIENSVFSTNASVSSAILYIDVREADSPNVTISNSRFEFNNAQGAVLITTTSGRVQVDHSTFNNNFLINYTSITSGLNVSVFPLDTLNPPDIQIFDNQFFENHGGRGGGISLYIDSQNYPTISVSNNRFTNNYAGFLGGGVYALITDSGIISVSKNYFQRNFAEGAGAFGGAVDIVAATPLANTNQITVDKNIFIDNSANNLSAVGGGALSLTVSGGTANVTNNFVMANKSIYGGGVFVNAMRGAIVQVVNNSFSGNNASTQLGDALYSRLSNEDTTLNIYNNIVWDPAPGTGTQVYISDDYEKNQLGAKVNLVNNDYGSFDIDIGDALTTAGNIINQDPLFVTNVTHWDLTAWDLHLQVSSPVKDLGSNTAPGLPSTDIDGQNRILNSIVDMGADELLLNVPDIQTNTMDINAGSVSIGSNSDPLALVFTNRGSANLTIDSITLSGNNADEFSIQLTSGTTPCQNTPIVLGANQSCTSTVVFSPLTQGSKSAALDIHSDDPDSASMAVSLTGVAYIGSGKPNDGDTNGSSGDGGACFIATAAYGSYLQNDVKYLRVFRDQVLLRSNSGRDLVKFYYRHSPQVAAMIKESELLKLATRAALTPLVDVMKHPVTQTLLKVD